MSKEVNTRPSRVSGWKSWNAEKSKRAEGTNRGGQTEGDRHGKKKMRLKTNRMDKVESHQFYCLHLFTFIKNIWFHLEPDINMKSQGKKNTSPIFNDRFL